MVLTVNAGELQRAAGTGGSCGELLAIKESGLLGDHYDIYFFQLLILIRTLIKWTPQAENCIFGSPAHP